jgi:hypothetical protein
MSKRMIKTLCTGFAWFMFSGCGQESVRVLTDDPMVMLRSQSTFTIRKNPCGCIVNRQALDYEIRLGSQWRRVFIESTKSNAKALVSLRTYFLKHPRSHRQIEGPFLEVFYQWLPGHHAPGIAINEVLSLAESGILPPVTHVRKSIEVIDPASAKP